MSFEIGTTVDNYEFLDILSSSKSEIKYRVRNTLAQRLEVLRILPKNLQDDQERVERFLREMKVHARLVHPNIVAFYNAAELNRQLVMTTELVEGSTLADRLAPGPLPWQEAVNYAGQALAALGYAHAQGIVHRDIAPENMIITPEGTLKIADFGLARTVSSPQLTQVGTVVGTLKYISPEQVKGSPVLDPRSDLYSLGVVLYEAVAGKTPFDSKSQFELMLAHVSELPKPPSEINPHVPQALDRLILKAIAKDPAQRFQSAAEFHTALEDARAALEKPAEAARPEPAPAPAPPPAMPAGAEAPRAAPVPPPVLPEPLGGVPPMLFRQASADNWGSRQLTIVGIMSAAMAVLILIAYMLARN